MDVMKSTVLWEVSKIDEGISDEATYQFCSISPVVLLREQFIQQYSILNIGIFIIVICLVSSVFANGPGDLGSSQVASYQRL